MASGNVNFQCVGVFLADTMIGKKGLADNGLDMDLILVCIY